MRFFNEEELNVSRTYIPTYIGWFFLIKVTPHALTPQEIYKDLDAKDQEARQRKATAERADAERHGHVQVVRSAADDDEEEEDDDDDEKGGDVLKFNNPVMEDDATPNPPPMLKASSPATDGVPPVEVACVVPFDLRKGASKKAVKAKMQERCSLPRGLYSGMSP